MENNIPWILFEHTGDVAFYLTYKDGAVPDEVSGENDD